LEWSNLSVINADRLCRTYIVYENGLFAQGVRSVLEEQCGVKVVGMESDVAKALKAVRSLKPEVIVVEECTGAHQRMRLGALLHSATAGRVVTLSLDHAFATVYQRNRIPATNLGELVGAIGGVAKQEIPGPDPHPGKVATPDLLDSGLGSDDDRADHRNTGAAHPDTRGNASECENDTASIMKSSRQMHLGKEAEGARQGSFRGKDGRAVRMNPKANREGIDG
jgi:hypothetical protein